MNNKIISRPDGESIFLKSQAKINLSLDIVGKREDGYHLVEMIMQTISLYDDIQITKTINPGEINIACSNKFVPCDSRNIAWKAADLIFTKFPMETAGFGVAIKIKKRIPVAGGLAGGSGNAAAVLKGMNALFSLNLSKKVLADLGLQLGADVPFCLQGGTCLAKNIGEDLTPISRLTGMHLVLLNPGKSLSTAKVYQTFNIDKIKRRPNTATLIEAIENRDIQKIAESSVNVLENPAFSLLPEIVDLKKDLISKGAINAVMSGSGPTVFGIFDNYTSAVNAYKSLRKKYKCYIAQSI